MIVEMENRLAGIGPMVDDNAETLICNAVLPGKLRSQLKDLTDNRSVIRRQIHQVRDVLAGNDQKVNRRLRINVPEGHQRFVLVNDIAFDLTFDNATKKTITHALLYS